jgi:hypothetical protein
VRDRFLKAFPVELEGDPGILERELERAASHRDGEAFGLAMMLGFLSGGFGERHARLLSGVLPEAWHTCHGDIASLLQDLASPASAEALHRTATLEFGYLPHDGSLDRARKCTWAPADIGTPAARVFLQDLAGCPEKTIAGYAQRRLDQWEAERPRKRGRG